MTRLLFWIALIILVVMAVRSKVRAAMAARGHVPPQAPQAGQAGARASRRVEESESMSCCAQCGVYFPSSEAVRAGGREYCCGAHAQQAAAQHIDRG